MPHGHDRDRVSFHGADFDARGDAIMWVTPGATSGHGSGPALQAAIRKLQDLQADLAQLLRLRKREAEYQASVAPSLSWLANRWCLMPSCGDQVQSKNGTRNSRFSLYNGRCFCWRQRLLALTCKSFPAAGGVQARWRAVRPPPRRAA